MSDSENIQLDDEKIDEATLGLLWLTCFKHTKFDEVFSAWKGHDFEVMNRLHEKGLIYDPVNKNKSISFTPEGEKLAKELCYKLFAKD